MEDNVLVCAVYFTSFTLFFSAIINKLCEYETDNKNKLMSNDLEQYMFDFFEKYNLYDKKIFINQSSTISGVVMNDLLNKMNSEFKNTLVFSDENTDNINIMIDDTYYNKNMSKMRDFLFHGNLNLDFNIKNHSTFYDNKTIYSPFLNVDYKYLMSYAKTYNINYDDDIINYDNDIRYSRTFNEFELSYGRTRDIIYIINEYNKYISNDLDIYDRNIQKYKYGIVIINESLNEIILRHLMKKHLSLNNDFEDKVCASLFNNNDSTINITTNGEWSFYSDSNILVFYKSELKKLINSKNYTIKDRNEISQELKSSIANFLDGNIYHSFFDIDDSSFNNLSDWFLKNFNFHLLNNSDYVYVNGVNDKVIVYNV